MTCQDLGKLGLAELLNDLYGRAALAPLLCVGIHAGPQRKMEYGAAAIPDYLGRGAMAGRYAAFVLDELLPCLEERSSRVEEYFASTQNCRGVAIQRQGILPDSPLGALSAMDIVWNHPQTSVKAGLFSGAFWWRSSR